jgi:hypothetical protein
VFLAFLQNYILGHMLRHILGQFREHAWCSNPDPHRCYLKKVEKEKCFTSTGDFSVFYTHAVLRLELRAQGTVLWYSGDDIVVLVRLSANGTKVAN